jgi:hypothetical protein
VFTSGRHKSHANVRRHVQQLGYKDDGKAGAEDGSAVTAPLISLFQGDGPTYRARDEHNSCIHGKYEFEFSINNVFTCALPSMRCP